MSGGVQQCLDESSHVQRNPEVSKGVVLSGGV